MTIEQMMQACQIISGYTETSSLLFDGAEHDEIWLASPASLEDEDFAKMEALGLRYDEGSWHTLI
jgi:hypothetical protein